MADLPLPGSRSAARVNQPSSRPRRSSKLVRRPSADASSWSRSMARCRASWALTATSGRALGMRNVSTDTGLSAFCWPSPFDATRRRAVVCGCMGSDDLCGEAAPAHVPRSRAACSTSASCGDASRHWARIRATSSVLRLSSAASSCRDRHDADLTVRPARLWHLTWVRARLPDDVAIRTASLAAPSCRAKWRKSLEESVDAMPSARRRFLRLGDATPESWPPSAQRWTQISRSPQRGRSAAGDTVGTTFNCKATPGWSRSWLVRC
mmetsp:Transcript_31939/g.92789  ORF Transcript_31939/g.92789 Transcript_31939/m.92789 type:complete len:266 (+) Transcript_31939:1462-2259(+)